MPLRTNVFLAPVSTGPIRLSLKAQRPLMTLHGNLEFPIKQDVCRIVSLRFK
jgi:hypothetical protein